MNDAYISPTPPNAVSRLLSVTPSPGPSTALETTPLSHFGKPSSSFPKKEDRLFKFVKKTGASLRSRVVKVKNLALGKRYGKTNPCKARNCKTCPMISERDSFKFNEKCVKAAEGTCSSYNIIYLFICNICSKHYVGRSTRALKTRVGEHRRHFYRMIENPPSDDVELSDEFALAKHIYDHGFRDKNDFGFNYSVCLLEICSPKILDVKEHRYIHITNSLSPFGLNVSNPLSVPLLHR